MLLGAKLLLSGIAEVLYFYILFQSMIIIEDNSMMITPRLKTEKLSAK